MNKKSKKALFYCEIKQIIQSKVTWELENIEEIKRDTKKYIQSQKHLKRVTHKIFDNNFLMFIIAEKMLDLFPKDLKIYNFSEYESYVTMIINNIGLYKIKDIDSPDITTNMILCTYKEKIKNMYYVQNEITQKQKKILESLKAIKTLNSIKGFSKEVDMALRSAEEKFKELIK